MVLPETSEKSTGTRDSWRPVIAWLGGGVLLIMLLWSAVLSEIARDESAWQQGAEESVDLQADAQARRLQAMFDDIRQITALLTAAREAGADDAMLQRQIRSVSARRAIYPFFADADGSVTSSRTNGVLGMDVSQEAWFREAKAGASVEPRVYRAEGMGDLGGQAVMRFISRVNRDDHQFDGVVVISVPEYFFRDTAPAPGVAEDESITVWLADGTALLHIRGNDKELPRQIRSGIESAREVTVLRYPQGSDEDRQRIIGWRRLSAFPLFVTVSASSASMMGSESKLRVAHLWAGAISSVLVLVGCMFGIRWQQSREALRRERDAVSTTFRLAVDGAREAFYMVSAIAVEGSRKLSFRVEDCNEFAGRLSGMPSRDIVGRQFADVFPGFEAVALKALLLEALREGFRELELAGDDDRPGMPGWLNFSAVRSSGGIAVSVRDVTAQKESEKQLRSLALTDALTLLPNRHWLQQNLGAAIETARTTGDKLALLFIDLDDFKKINDSLGYAAGDEFLIAVANALKQTLRTEDTVVRLGGDEFTVLATRVSGRDDVAAICRQIVECVAHVECEAIRRGFVGRASVGAALFPDDAEDDASLMQSADIAMYAAKAEGKGRFCMYSWELAMRVQSRLSLEQGLRQALAGNELQLYYQPRVSARSGALLSFEALLRWVRPDGSVVEPSRFIPIAEQSDLIVEIGKWVAKESCRQIAAWREQGLGALPVSINVSARQLRTECFRHELAAQLASHRVAPSQIALELTESAMVGDDASVRRELREMRQMGLELHIDDFGTGYSSLSQLQNLDVDVIKIDRSFVSAIGAREQGRVLCEAMVQMGRTLGFRVVAEGVETLMQLRELQAMRCDEIQGHYVSAAVPAAAVPGLIARGTFFDPMFPVVQRMINS